MAIKKYFAVKDNVITNAFKPNLTTRGTGSNMGASDVLEVFSIYGQASTASFEAARTLVQFPISTISANRTAGTIPASGSVNFYLKLSNVEHGETLPRDFTLAVSALSRSWEEGSGLDMEGYSDLTKDGEGSNWINAASGTLWTTQGGDYITGTYSAGVNTPTLKQTFPEGPEDLDLDITPMVEEWIAGTITNNGIIVYLTASQETALRSYYTKRFSARGSEYYYQRPIIEARWDDSIKDDRGKFFVSSALAPSTVNNNTIYLYNYINNQLTNIPAIGTGSIYVSLHTSGSGGTQLGSVVTGSYVSTGIYSATFALNTTASIVYDRWFSGSIYYFTGSFNPITQSAGSSYLSSRNYVTSITNMRSSYSKEEKVRWRIFTRLRNRQHTLYTVAQAAPTNNIIEDAYYRIYRISDQCDIIPYGTGSTNHTRLSYDKDGNFMNLDMSLFEPGYAYGLKFIYYIDSDYEEQKETFKFRVLDL